jgi:drug/metabolite transporter (DMT)-like permease
MTSGSSARLRLLAAAAFFSTGGAAIKACALSGVQIAGLRSGIAALTFLVLIPAARSWPSWRACLVGSAYAATLVLYVIANKHTTAANTIFLQSTAPLYILLAAPFVLGERILRRDVLFMLALAGGLALFFVDENRSVATAPRPLLGNMLALASGVGWAATVMGLRWLGRDTAAGPRANVSAVVAGNALAFLACAPFLWPLDARPADWAILSYLGVFQIGLAYVFVTAALSVLPAFEASLILLVEPVLNPIWAWIVHGERPGPWALAGCAAIVVAMLAKTMGDVRAASRAPARAA